MSAQHLRGYLFVVGESRRWKIANWKKYRFQENRNLHCSKIGHFRYILRRFPLAKMYIIAILKGNERGASMTKIRVCFDTSAVSRLFDSDIRLKSEIETLKELFHWIDERE